MQNKSSASSNGGGRFRSKSKALHNDDEAMSQSPSSTTEDDESQSLRQSSGDTGGVRGLRLEEDGGATAGRGGLGPLNDSTVLLKLLEVGLWGIIWWCGGYRRRSMNGSLGF